MPKKEIKLSGNNEQRRRGQELAADERSAYQQAQAAGARDNPLEAIKKMRLKQLAACRLSSEKEMQLRRHKRDSSDSDEEVAAK